MQRFWASALLAVMLSGCVTVTDINESFRRIDRLWALEYQRDEDKLRYRVVEADYPRVFQSVRAVFLGLGMPLETQDMQSGRLVARSTAPTPLTQDEWVAIVKEEAPRVKEIGGWYMVLNNDAKDYTVTVIARVRAVGDNTVVVLDYEMDAPKYRAMGFLPSKTAPPAAVKLASYKFWNSLQSELAKVKAPPPRERNTWEQSA